MKACGSWPVRKILMSARSFVSWDVSDGFWIGIQFNDKRNWATLRSSGYVFVVEYPVKLLNTN